MWQFLILLYFVFGSASYLLRRVLAQELGEHIRAINAVFFLFFLLPAIPILVFFFPHNLHVGVLNLFLLIIGSAIWPICNLLALHSNKKVDVGIFTIISNLSPIFTILIAIPFLHESLNTVQIAGAGLLITSGIIATVSQMRGSNKISTDGILACLLSALVLGVAVAYERFMLSRVDFGTYLVFGWGAQIFWAVFMARKEIQKLPELFKKGLRIKKLILVWGAVTLFKSLSFILSLKISSASVISVATDFMSVVVVISAYFFLNERKHINYKIIATIVGVAGLLLIAR